MISRIKKLSPLLINQLSAGEVVTRPASVVKELLENAIDSQADKISIYIKQGGMELIEVVDNGSGIYPDDMLMAITRHATSKVADVEQLHGINTLGFRGEALASISAVSRLTLTSCADNSGVGRQLTVAGQIDNPNITPIVCKQGTSVSVQDLYFNVPARRGNLKSIATEYAHIENMVRHIALAYSNISLYLYHDGKARLQLSSDKNNSLTRLQNAFYKPLPHECYPLYVDLSMLCSAEEKQKITNNPQINGWLWHDKTGTYNQLPRLIYINSRLVKNNHIEQHIRQSVQKLAIDYHKIGYALFFELPNEWLNLNIHPTKQRINIYALANINLHLQQAIERLLVKNPFIKQPIDKKIEKDNHKQVSVNSVQYGKNNPISSHVASPKASYQVNKIDQVNNDNNQHINSAINSITNDNIINKTQAKTFQLKVITINQNTPQKAEKLAKIICQTLDITAEFTINRYDEMDNSYCITINFVLANDNKHSIAQIIELTDRIASPWTVKYQGDIDEVMLIFSNNQASQLRNIAFNVIQWASCEIIE